MKAHLHAQGTVVCTNHGLTIEIRSSFAKDIVHDDVEGGTDQLAVVNRVHHHQRHLED